MLHSIKLSIIAISVGLLLAGCNSGSSNSIDHPQQPPTGSAPPNDSAPAPGAPDGGDDDDAGNTPPPGDGGTPPPADEDPDGTPPEQPEQQKPVIISTDPQDHDEAVALVPTITVVFDTVIDPASVASSQISLIGPTGDEQVTVKPVGDTLLITPTRKLASNAAYTATVGAGIRNLDGYRMNEDYSWQFVTANAITGVCSDFYSSGFSLIQGKDTRSPSSSMSKPPRGQPYSDPAYKTCVTRGSNASYELGVGWVRNDYSRRQAFNADDSLYLVIARFGRWFIHNTDDTRIVRELPLNGGGLEPQWHPTDPDLLYVFDNEGGFRIRTLNVKTGNINTVADLRNVAGIAGHPGKTSITQVWSNAARAWTRWEGSPSQDARHWALMIQTSGQDGLGMITYDMQTNTITGVYDYAKDGNGVPQPDYVSMSPSGKYMVAGWAAADRQCSSYSSLGTRTRPCGTMSFTADFSTAVGLSTRGEHSDIGFNADGREYYVYSGYTNGWVTMVDITNGNRTNLFNIYENGNSTAMHISAKNFNKPGWVLVSTYREKTGGTWYVNKIFAVEMKANPRILNIAHSYNRSTSYFSETHASVNRDFTRILFNSNWRSGNEDMDVYLIKLPDDAIPAR